MSLKFSSNGSNGVKNQPGKDSMFKESNFIDDSNILHMISGHDLSIKKQGYEDYDMGDIGDEVDHNEISEEDRPFLILNKDTGKYYDLRNGKTIEKLTRRTTTLSANNDFSARDNQSNAWSDWWKEKKKNNNSFLNAAENGDLNRLKQLTDKKVMMDL